MHRFMFFIAVLYLFSGTYAHSQKYIEPQFQVEIENGIEYGTSPNVAGIPEVLTLNLGTPVGDTIPDCGRPLVIIIHGGAWIIGSPSDAIPTKLLSDMASRGYAAASVEYRLGMIPPDRDIHCNVPDWDCFNQTDTSEWYRANYRGIQDVHGAIRYLVNNADRYDIDPNNIFLIGESAGGFVALGVGFIDDESEILHDNIMELPDAPRPHQRYENQCIINKGVADDIDQMDLSRPDLGPVEGTLNLPAESEYEIKAVANIYGGMFNNIMENHKNEAPALYMLHQPCDLLVPFNSGKALRGLNTCFRGFPTFCQNIINRPLVYGSNGIKAFIDTLQSNSIPTSDYITDFSNNIYDCLYQATNNYSCHGFFDYPSHILKISTLFKSTLDTCATSASDERVFLNFNLFPNPAADEVIVTVDKLQEYDITIFDIYGQVCWQNVCRDNSEIKIDIRDFKSGIYFVTLSTESGVKTEKLIVD